MSQDRKKIVLAFLWAMIFCAAMVIAPAKSFGNCSSYMGSPTNVPGWVCTTRAEAADMCDAYVETGKQLNGGRDRYCGTFCEDNGYVGYYGNDAVDAYTYDLILCNGYPCGCGAKHIIGAYEYTTACVDPADLLCLFNSPLDPCSGDPCCGKMCCNTGGSGGGNNPGTAGN